LTSRSLPAVAAEPRRRFPSRASALSDRVYLGLGAAVLLGAALRFSTLDARSYWVDEAYTVDLAQKGFVDAMASFADPIEATPPFYFVLAWLWAQVFGVGEVGLRSLSALIGTLTILVVYAIGARLVSRRVGLVAAVIAAVSPILIWHAQDARAYATVILLSGLSFLFL